MACVASNNITIHTHTQALWYVVSIASVCRTSPRTTTISRCLYASPLGHNVVDMLANTRRQQLKRKHQHHEPQANDWYSFNYSHTTTEHIRRNTHTHLCAKQQPLNIRINLHNCKCGRRLTKEHNSASKMPEQADRKVRCSTTLHKCNTYTYV